MEKYCFQGSRKDLFTWRNSSSIPLGSAPQIQMASDLPTSQGSTEKSVPTGSGLPSEPFCSNEQTPIKLFCGFSGPYTFIQTWWRAVNPSIFAVFISAPRSKSFSTSSLSALEQAARNTQPSWNFILDFVLSLGTLDSLFVSDKSQRRSCSSRLHSAFLGSAMVPPKIDFAPST